MRKPFQPPRRPAVRPFSEPIERDDGGSTPYESQFITLLGIETGLIAAPVADDDDDDVPAFLRDDGQPPGPGLAEINAQVRLHTRKLK